ncbi:MAG: GHKL domain-containing protein [Clostridiales bacterium]|nr:GHKL domain-containing protein [Clostridiales bacterium]
MTLSLFDALGPIADAFLAQYYFSTADDDRDIPQFRKRVSFGILLLLIPLAIHELGVFTLTRFFLRAVCYVLYLACAKGIRGRRGLFLSIFTASCFVIGQNIFLSPVTYALRELPALTTLSPWVTPFLSIVIHSLVLLPVRFFLPLDHIGEPTLPAWLSLGVTVLCVMATRNLRWSGNDFSDSGNLLFILLQIFMLLFLVMSERERHVTNQEHRTRLQNALNEERLRHYESQYRADKNIRSLHHDMQNHLLAIRSMTADTNGQLELYLDSLIHQLQETPVTIETGNPTLDGLLCQKLPFLQKYKISHDVILDFRNIRFIRDMDICTIFGNLIDNAIEACLKVEPSEKRFLNIHSEIAAGQLILSFVNSYCGDPPQMKRGLPVTSKNDSRWHGLGLSNVRRTVQRYGGVTEIDLSVPEQFSLTILLPFPVSQQP